MLNEINQGLETPGWIEVSQGLRWWKLVECLRQATWNFVWLTRMWRSRQTDENRIERWTQEATMVPNRHSSQQNFCLPFLWENNSGCWSKSLKERFRPYADGKLYPSATKAVTFLLMLSQCTTARRNWFRWPPQCVSYCQQSAAATGRDQLPTPKATWKVSPNGSPRVELDSLSKQLVDTSTSIKSIAKPGYVTCHDSGCCLQKHIFISFLIGGNKVWLHMCIWSNQGAF